MSGRTLVLYYSLSGNTRAIAAELQQALGADLEEIRESHPRRGLRGVLGALIDLMLAREPTVLAPQRDPSQYDLVVIGGPIWARRYAAPVREFARRYLGSTRRVALFCTCGSRGAERAFGQMRRNLVAEVVATLGIVAADLAPERHREALAVFVASAERAMAAGLARSRRAA